ncbi:MAG TPA: TIR domain-containing protein, partial [Thermoanaerobaculia bacterium]|nr:TIR domain-containing protein [Thermoanaerobaculia bacterium]
MSELTPNPRPTELPAKGNICDLFLSYNSGDLASVREIQSSLSERQIITFFDRQSLVAGKPWLTALDDALRKVRAVAVFIGKDGLGMWQKREVSVALDRQAADERAGREFPVIPILLPEADIERAPSFLYLNTWIDLRGSLKEPESMDALVRAVLRQPPLPAIKASVALCPYRALRAFREEDAQLFFGREHFAEKLLEKVRAHALVAVVGPSGSGKSSVAQAGLLPLLRRESSPSPAWEAIICAPGKRPFHNLAAALIPLWEVGQDKTEILIKTEKLGSGLADGSVSLEAAIKLALKESPGTDRLLIIVDQFEELLTLTPEAERKKFLDTLLGSLQSSLSTVMLTIRDDFYGPAIALSRELSDMIPQGQINLGPMRVEELQRAVEQPAQSVGLDFEAGLV